MAPSASSSPAAIIAEYSTLSVVVILLRPVGHTDSLAYTRTNLNYCGLAGFGALFLVRVAIHLRLSCPIILVLILHDYLVTFRQEVNMFWTRKLNGAAILFYMNRYAFITVYAIYQLSTYAPISDEVRLSFYSFYSCLHAYEYDIRGTICRSAASMCSLISCRKLSVRESSRLRDPRRGVCGVGVLVSFFSS